MDVKESFKHCMVKGKKKSCVASALIKEGTGKIRVNYTPLDLLEPSTLRAKAQEPVVLLGQEEYFKKFDIQVRVRGGGNVAKIQAARQAIAKAIIAQYGKYVDEYEKNKIKELYLSQDKKLLIADPRRMEPKKQGGPGARARKQKSYR